MRDENESGDAFAVEHSVDPAPGRAQTSAPPCIDADIAAIRELQDRIRYLWTNLAALSREDLGAHLELLRIAADHRDTDAKPVRRALQHVLLTLGTDALATLREPTRQRLSALTGIALPGSTAPTSRPSGTAPRPTQSTISPGLGGDG